MLIKKVFIEPSNVPLFIFCRLLNKSSDCVKHVSIILTKDKFLFHCSKEYNQIFSELFTMMGFFSLITFPVRLCISLCSGFCHINMKVKHNNESTLFLVATESLLRVWIENALYTSTIEKEKEKIWISYERYNLKINMPISINKSTHHYTSLTSLNISRKILYTELDYTKLIYTYMIKWSANSPPKLTVYEWLWFQKEINSSIYQN